MFNARCIFLGLDSFIVWARPALPNGAQSPLIIFAPSVLGADPINTPPANWDKCTPFTRGCWLRAWGFSRNLDAKWSIVWFIFSIQIDLWFLFQIFVVASKKTSFWSRAFVHNHADKINLIRSSLKLLLWAILSNSLLVNSSVHFWRRSTMIKGRGWSKDENWNGYFSLFFYWLFLFFLLRRNAGKLITWKQITCVLPHSETNITDCSLFHM